MTDSNATELRSLLDKAGIAHRDFRKATNWTGKFGENVISYTMTGGLMCVKHTSLTPEQAVAATLGSGTCTVTSNLNCSNCGKRIGVVRNCEMYETCDGRQAWKSLDHEVCDIPNYCPNCGAKVVNKCEE